MNHQQVLHGILLEDGAAFCATLIAKTVDLAVFRQRREENACRLQSLSFGLRRPEKNGANGNFLQKIRNHDKLAL
jgi:hypothetical protein